jgi:hypothetical protein
MKKVRLSGGSLESSARHSAAILADGHNHRQPQPASETYFASTAESCKAPARLAANAQVKTNVETRASPHSTGSP